MKVAYVMSLFLFGITLLFVEKGFAQYECTAPDRCTGIEYNGEIQCVGAGGCSDSFPWETCTSTCFCGSCVSRGSSGLCCGHLYYVPNFYAGSGDCTAYCGNVAVHARSHINRESSDRELALVLRGDNTPGRIMLTSSISYREPVFVYALDCSHTFRLVVE